MHRTMTAHPRPRAIASPRCARTGASTAWPPAWSRRPFRGRQRPGVPVAHRADGAPPQRTPAHWRRKKTA